MKFTTAQVVVSLKRKKKFMLMKKIEFVHDVILNFFLREKQKKNGEKKFWEKNLIIIQFLTRKKIRLMNICEKNLFTIIHSLTPKKAKNVQNIVEISEKVF